MGDRRADGMPSSDCFAIGLALLGSVPAWPRPRDSESGFPAAWDRDTFAGRRPMRGPRLPRQPSATTVPARSRCRRLRRRIPGMSLANGRRWPSRTTRRWPRLPPGSRRPGASACRPACIRIRGSAIRPARSATKGRPGNRAAFIGQEFVTNGKLKRSREVAEQAIQQAQCAWAVQHGRGSINDVRRAFYDVLVAQRTVELTDQLVRIGQEGVRAADGSCKAKEASRFDVLAGADRGRFGPNHWPKRRETATPPLGEIWRWWPACPTCRRRRCRASCRRAWRN